MRAASIPRGIFRCVRKVAANITWPAACGAALACARPLQPALADNPVGRLVEDFILQGGVDTTYLRWVPYDGVGREVRNGLNFTGARVRGVRGAVGCSDRGLTAASQIKSGDFDWGGDLWALKIEEDSYGSRWFHTGGIFAALSASSAQAGRGGHAGRRAQAWHAHFSTP